MLHFLFFFVNLQIINHLFVNTLNKHLVYNKHGKGGLIIEVG